MRRNPRVYLSSGLLILDFYESWDDLSPDYSLTFLLIWVENWWCMVTTLGCAIIHYLWGKASCNRHKMFSSLWTRPLTPVLCAPPLYVCPTVSPSTTPLRPEAPQVPRERRCRHDEDLVRAGVAFPFVCVYRGGFLLTGSFRGDNSKREDNWSAMSAVDELDAEIEFWLKHKPVREYYKQFALEEFTAENPAFLGKTLVRPVSCPLLPFS